MGEDCERPLLVRLALLGDAKVLPCVLCEAEEVFKNLILLWWIDAGMWVDLGDVWAPVLAATNPLHPLEAAEGGLVAWHEEAVPLAGLVEGLLV